MTETGQQSLGEYGSSRPDAEADAVAGEGDADALVIDPARETLGEASGVLELAVMQVDYTIEGRGSDERPLVHVFGRTDDGESVHVRVRGFEPYFYAPADQVDPADLATYDRITDWTKTGEDGEPFESIRGEELIRIYGQTPRDVGEIRDDFEHFEADIPFPNRFLIDKGVRTGIQVPDRRDGGAVCEVHHEEVQATTVEATPRVCFLDIEVDDRNGFPEDGEEPIACLTTHDSRTDEYVGWLYEAPEGDGAIPSDLPEYEVMGEGSLSIRSYETEEGMLEDLVDYISKRDFDVLSGWNFEDFDAPYLLDRLEKLDPQTGRNIEPDRLSRVGEVWRSGWGGPDVKGRVIFDLLYAYRRTKFTELDSYRLDDVAEMELGVGKERYQGDIGDLWETDPERLLEYNVRDVELCVELDRKQDIIPFWNEVRAFVGCKLEDATTPGDAVDMYVLHTVHGDYALPSKGNQKSEDYEGGAVFDPITGVRENVSVLDLKSLYPMCMVTINASPETKVDPTEYNGATYRAPNGTQFRQEPDGIIRSMVDELLAEREQKKEQRNDYDPDSEEYERYDRQQAAVKVIMNSLYGVLGWERFRLYDKEMGAAVTATGREVIKHTESAANDLGKEVIYGDTDSVMLELGGDVDRKAAIEQSFEIEEYINDSYDDFAQSALDAEDHRFQIEFEKLYRRFFQAGKKKRYAGHIIWKEGKEVDDIDITGFEYQRSDIAPITKEVQLEVIERIVRGEDIDSVTDYVHDVIEDFLAGNVDVEEVAIPGGIGKRLDNYDTDTAHVRGAKYANMLLGTNFARGSKPKRVYLESVHPDFFQEREDAEEFTPQEDHLYREFKRDPDVICFEYADQLPAEFDVDWEKMLDKTLKGPISRVLSALDVSWEEVRSGQEQTGLGQYI